MTARGQTEKWSQRWRPGARLSRRVPDLHGVVDEGRSIVECRWRRSDPSGRWRVVDHEVVPALGDGKRLSVGRHRGGNVAHERLVAGGRRPLLVDVERQPLIARVLWY